MKQKGLPGLQKKIKKVYPNQYICEEYANYIKCNDCYYPIQVKRYDGSETLELSNTKLYYLRNVVLLVRSEILWAYTMLYWTNGVAIAVNGCTVNASVENIPLGLMVPKGTPELRTYSETDVECITWVYYAAIDVLPGELNPKVVEE